MEEKMLREKNRNRVKDDDDDEIDENDTETNVPENTTIDMSNNEYQVDDEGQIHSIDNAVQGGPNLPSPEDTDDKNEFG